MCNYIYSLMLSPVICQSIAQRKIPLIFRINEFISKKKYLLLEVFLQNHKIYLQMHLLKVKAMWKFVLILKIMLLF